MIEMIETAQAPVIEAQQAQPLAVHRPQALQPAAVTTPTQLLAFAVQQGNMSIEQMRELMAMEREFRADLAKQAYAKAFAGFKAEAVEIIKRKRVNFESKRTGTTTDYKHAELSDVIEAVTPALAKHGLSASWRMTEQKPDWITVECTLRHCDGYSESVSMGGPPDDSGNKNRLQAIASTQTYLERYTLKAICGVAEKGDDDDGAGGSPGSAAVDLLDVWRAEALKGDKALRAYYNANVPTEAFWTEHGPALRKAARDADADKQRGVA